MTPLGIALAHIARRPGRAALVLCGLAAATAVVAGLVTLAWTMDATLTREMAQRGVTALVRPEREEWSLSFAGLRVGSAVREASQLPPGAVETLGRAEAAERAESPLRLMAPKLLHLVGGPDGQPVLAVGVEWVAERALRPHWEIRGAYPAPAAGGEGGVVLGADLAELWGVGLQDRIRLDGGLGAEGGSDGSAAEFLVAGVLEPTGDQEDGVVLLDLGRLQELAGRPGAVSYIELRAPADPAEQAALVAGLEGAVPGIEVTLVRGVDQARVTLLDRIQDLVPLTAGLALAAGAALVAASQFSAARDRVREVGVLRAIGYRRRQVLKVFLVEVAGLAGAAGSAGYLIGVGLARVALPLLDPAGATAVVAWSLPLAVGLLAGTILVGLAAAYWPVQRMAAADPAAAMRLF